MLQLPLKQQCFSLVLANIILIRAKGMALSWYSTHSRNSSFLPLALIPSQILRSYLKFLPVLLLGNYHLIAAAEESGVESVQTGETINFNVYQYESLDPLLELGLAMQELEEHEQAVRYFKQARQVSRIHDGFYDEAQVILLEAIIESEMALKNWQAVDNHYTHMEFLYRKMYSIDDPQLEAGLQQVSGWLSYALSVNPVGNRIDQLRKANRIYRLRLQIAERTLEANDPKFGYLRENIAICEKQLYQFLDKDGTGMKRSRRDPFLARAD